jgi:trk system potassium uptake protein TrkH
MLALWHGGALTIGERVAFSELVGGVRLVETRRLIATVVKVTLTIEFFGALAFWLLWRGRLDHPLLQGAFHSISAFCNAGFSLFSDSFASFRSDPPTLIILMLLIVAGGAGFPVVANLSRVGISRIIPWIENRSLNQASRVVLITSGALIALGAALFMIDGWLYRTPRPLLDAVFQSVTTRTAGFQVESQLRFNTFGLASTILLMLIGASPQSTGGGIKTAVWARLFKRLDPRDEPQSSRWLIAFKPFRIALLLAGFYLLSGAAATILLIYTDHLVAGDAAFEAFSALGTVGLSRDVTPSLSAAGKWIDIILMFTGRVLYPILVMWMIRGRRESPDPVPWA